MRLQIRVYVPLILTFVALILPMLPATAQPTDSCSVPKSQTRVRPDADGPPIRVNVGVYLIDLVDVDELQESFKVDFLVSYRWRDPRLSEEARGGRMDDCVLGLQDIWDPDIHPVNQRGIIRERARDVDIAPDGTVHFSERILAELSTRLQLDDFPFDRQELKIQLVSFEYGPEDVLFEVDSDASGKLADIFIGGWDIENSVSNANIPPLAANITQHTRLEHTITVERRSGYFVWRFIVPLSFIVLMAWSVFWIDPRTAAPQIGVATASVFSLIAFLVGLRGVLPRVEYLTLLDKLVLSATVLVFLALAEAVVTTRLATQDRYDTANKVDRISKWVYLALFVGIFIVQLML